MAKAKRKARVTTSVSSLIQNFTDLESVAEAAGREDLSEALADILPRLEELVKLYAEVSGEIRPLHKRFCGKSKASKLSSLLNVDDSDEDSDE